MSMQTSAAPAAAPAFHAAVLLNFTPAEIAVGGVKVATGASYPIGAGSAAAHISVPGATTAPIPLGHVLRTLAAASYMHVPATQATFYRAALGDGTPVVLLSAHSRTAEIPGKFVFHQGPLTLVYFSHRSNDIVPYGFVAAELPEEYTCNTLPQYDPNSIELQTDFHTEPFESEERVYAAERMMGSAEARRLAAASGAGAPIVMAKNKDGSLTPKTVNYIAVDSIVSGRGRKNYGRDSYFDDEGIVKSDEFVMAAPRAEEYLQTRSFRTEFGELANPRVFANVTAPAGQLNLTPIYASAECRQRQVNRLNKIYDSYVNARMNAEL